MRLGNRGRGATRRNSHVVCEGRNRRQRRKGAMCPAASGVPCAGKEDGMKQLLCLLISLCLAVGILVIAVADINNGAGLARATSADSHGDVHEETGHEDDHASESADHGHEEEVSDEHH